MKKKSEGGGASSNFEITEYQVHIETKVALLELSITHINESLININENLKEIKKDMKYDFRFLVTAICGLAAVMAHGFHWF